MEIRRIVTHTDFDGLACAVLLSRALGVTQFLFIEPSDIQRGTFMAEPTDAIADLPLPTEGCALWFDHHPQPAPESPAYHLDPSARSCAGLIHRTYQGTHDLSALDPLAAAAERIDSAQYTPEDILHPDAAGRISLALTRAREDAPFRERLIGILLHRTLEEAAQDPQVRELFHAEMEEQQRFMDTLAEHTRVDGAAIITDLTGKEQRGANPFRLYLQFPESRYSIRIRDDERRPGTILVSVGKNNFAPKGKLHLGKLMRRYGGGGHADAAGCSLPSSEKETLLTEALAQINEDDTHSSGPAAPPKRRAP